MNRRLTGILAVMIATILTSSAHAVRVGDIAKLKGRRVNKLVGQGLVIGLNGTGDGGDYMPAIRPLASMLKRFNDPVFDLNELKNAKNVAIVQVEASLPDNGVREGDRVDVHVSSIGAAKSLVGGRLVLTPMQGPSPRATQILALASGAVLSENPDTPTVGLIRMGATMERSVLHTYIARAGDLEHRFIQIDPEGWYITLIIDDAHASHEMASVMAMAINGKLARADSDRRWAIAADPRNVVVQIPQRELADVATFIGKVETTELIPGITMASTEARIRINRSTGTIVVDGNVEISPAVVTHKGMTIRTVTPEPVPVPGVSRVIDSSWVDLNTQRLQVPNQTRKLEDLVEALTKLKLTIDDRIAIIEALHKTGKLHAKLILED